MNGNTSARISSDEEKAWRCHRGERWDGAYCCLTILAGSRTALEEDASGNSVRSAARGNGNDQLPDAGFQTQEGSGVLRGIFEDHTSLFPTSAPIEACKEELAGYSISKGTVRFPLEKPLPIALIKRLVKVRLEQSAAKAKG